MAIKARGQIWLSQSIAVRWLNILRGYRNIVIWGETRLELRNLLALCEPAWLEASIPARCINRGNHRSVIFRARQPVIPSQLDGRHSNPVVTTPMIALDFSGTTHQSASHNVAFNQISPGTANLKPSHTGHGNSAAKQLKHNFKTEENTYPQAYTNRGTLGQDFIESVERTGSSRFLKSTVPVSKLVSIGKETQEEFSATNIIQTTAGHDGNRRKSAMVNSSYRGIQRMEIRDIN
ncbi:hypothetical protein F511_20616 [Dorcoceras hygrometricum]|uniref:Uncharacterized protein n=1 Tax=Dorcoceras hygrometricum TaxID=472368 RepID=A0A2Z7D9R5_9LAMI|nr:hypothetical protein F511_20616 [Dorcoceras hygrometricum]